MTFAFCFFASSFSAKAQITPLNTIQNTVQSQGWFRNQLPGTGSLNTQPGGGLKPSTRGGLTSGGGSSGNPISPTTIEGVLTSIMSYLRGIAGTIAVIFIIIGGMMYMLSGGNKDAIQQAQNAVNVLMKK